MSELRSLIDAARSLRLQQTPFWVATVVDVRGSSYRKPGARMLFDRERWLAGSISGGCLERDVLARGAWHARDGARLLSYDSSDEEVGSGCEGVVDVLIERVDAEQAADPLRVAEHCLARELPAAVCTIVQSARDDLPVGSRLALLADGQPARSTIGDLGVCAQLEPLAARALADESFVSATLPCAGMAVFVERITPPPHLFVFGSAHDALPVVTLARSLGWQVSACERHVQLTTRERFRAADHHLVAPFSETVSRLARCARPAAVVMTHHYESDLEALCLLLASPARYIGLLGSRKRAARLLDDAARYAESHGLAFDARADARLHTPVGLAIGADSPAEIALSIVAEALAFFAQGGGAARASGK